MLPDDSCKTTTRRVNGEKKKFQYTKPYDWHFRYRHAVDDHNNLRHALPSLEDTWTTTRWEIRVFTFLLAITEVNVYLALKFFVYLGNLVETLPKYVAFRRKLAWEFINNPHLAVDDIMVEDTSLVYERQHKILKAPNHASEYRNRQWICEAAQPYQQHVCKWPGCKCKTRTYCQCTPGHWLCPEHILEHAIEATRAECLNN